MRQLPSGTRALAVVSVFIATTSLAFSQSIAALSDPPIPIDPKSVSSSTSSPEETTKIVNGFLAAEGKVREALNQHAFKRDVVLQTIGPNGEVTGEYIRNSQFVFDDSGKRIERVLFHPKSTIREMRITKEDIQDLAGGQLLGIDVAEVAKYRITYVGVELIESRQLLALDISPAQSPNPNRMKDRYFVGRVWLDPMTLQIVKIKGIVEPQGKQRFPIFETWRDLVKESMSFPTRTEADDVLHFKTGDVHYRIKVRYYDYKLFGSKVSVTELDEPIVNDNGLSPKPAATPGTPNGNVDRNTPAPNNLKPAPIKLPKISANPPLSTPTQCAANKSAPPTGPYHWPADSEVKVFFISNMFTAEQRAALLEAMMNWTAAGQENGSGVTFADGGETPTRMSCRGCLTVGRKEVYKRDKRHYAFFYPMREEGQLLVSAWIDLDVGITKPKALKGFMTHELGHGLGLWDCTTCKKKQTIMNGFPGKNKDNGLLTPSQCDLATVRNVYQAERVLASAKSATEKRADVGSLDNRFFNSPGSTQSVSPVMAMASFTADPVRNNSTSVFDRTQSGWLWPLLDLNRSTLPRPRPNEPSASESSPVLRNAQSPANFGFVPRSSIRTKFSTHDRLPTRWFLSGHNPFLIPNEN